MSNRANIYQLRPEVASTPIKSLMFLANDEAEHDLTWSPVSRSWMLENKHQGVIKFYPNLIAGLSALERASSHHDGSFTISQNPYWN